MATVFRNFSDVTASGIPSGKGKRIGIVVADWNNQITHKLRDGAIKTLIENNVMENDLEVHHVPGAFELTLGAEWLGQKENIDAIICIGCVIQGETPHFDFICQGVTYGLTELNISLSKPVIFAVLTTNNLEQAIARSGGDLGNKGEEAAVTALRMLALRTKMKV